MGCWKVGDKPTFLKGKELDAKRKSEKPTRLCVEFNQLVR